MKRSVAVLIIVFFLVVGWLVCAGASDAPKRGGTLKVTLPNAPPHLDINLSSAIQSSYIAWHMYEGLFEPTIKNEVKPHLAKNYTVSDDGLTGVIELRQGVRFHDGSEMTSEDAVASTNRWLKLTFAGKGVKRKIKGVRADGKYKVIVEFKSPYSPFVGMTAAFQKLIVFKKEIVDKFGDKIVTEHIGTGPYRFSKWMPNRFVELVRFDDYVPASQPRDWFVGKKTIYVDKLKWEFVKEEATRVAGVETGQYDYAMDVSTDQYDGFVANPNVVPYLIDPDVQVSIVFNRVKGRLFSDVNARRAIAAAIDIEEILGSGYGNPRFWRLNHAWFPKGHLWYSEAGKEKYNIQDMGKAKKLLTMSNYDGQPIIILGDLSSGIRGMGLAIQSQLKALGIDVKLDLMERASMAQKRKGNEWDIHLVPFRAAYPIPDVFSGWTGTNKWIGKWDDQDSHKIDQMFDVLAKTSNHEERFRIFEEIQGFHADIVPIIKLGEASRLQILHKRVNGFESATMPAFFNVWIDK